MQELQAAYEYLRVLENRLQQWNDEQTHQLPEDAEAREVAGRGALGVGHGVTVDELRVEGGLCCK